MDTRLRRTLILDTDPDTLITLQQVLEEGGIDATITWNEAEACQLLGTAPFDLILIGDHPPELNAAAILDDLSLRGTCPPVLILRGTICEQDAQFFCRLGASGVVLKRDPLVVLDQVKETLASAQLKADRPMTSSIDARSWLATR